jgi:hypothetical protein
VASTRSSRLADSYSTLEIETLSELLAGALTASVAVRVTPPYDEEIVAEVLELTLLVDTVNVALVDPAGTVTLAGTAAAVVLLLESATDAPPAGAADVSVTVPLDELPPVTLVGLRLSDDSAADCGGGAGAPDPSLVTKASP